MSMCAPVGRVLVVCVSELIPLDAPNHAQARQPPLELARG